MGCNDGGLQARHNQRDTQWAEWTCSLGFDVMAIFPDYSDGTDVDAVCRSYTNADPIRGPSFPLMGDPLAQGNGRVVATGDDCGKVRLYNYPCVVEDAPSRCYTAHSSHVKNVKFAFDNRCAMFMSVIELRLNIDHPESSEVATVCVRQLTCPRILSLT